MIGVSLVRRTVWNKEMQNQLAYFKKTIDKNLLLKWKKYNPLIEIEKIHIQTSLKDQSAKHLKELRFINYLDLSMSHVVFRVIASIFSFPSRFKEQTLFL